MGSKGHKSLYTTAHIVKEYIGIENFIGMVGLGDASYTELGVSGLFKKVVHIPLEHETKAHGLFLGTNSRILYVTGFEKGIYPNSMKSVEEAFKAFDPSHIFVTGQFHEKGFGYYVKEYLESNPACDLLYLGVPSEPRGNSWGDLISENHLKNHVYNLQKYDEYKLIETKEVLGTKEVLEKFTTRFAGILSLGGGEASKKEIT